MWDSHADWLSDTWDQVRDTTAGISGRTNEHAPAIGAALPHTEVEDKVVGDAAERVKESVSEKADDLLEKGKEVATDAYDQAIGVADAVYDVASERLKSDKD